MLRFCLTIIFLNFFVAICQLKSKCFLSAEEVKAVNTLYSIRLAKKAFAEAIKQQDSYNSCLAGIFLSDAYRKLGNYSSAIHYDSLATLQARQRKNDTLLQQRSTNSYARNFVELLQLDKAETTLTKDTALFTDYYTIETCLWYEMKALCCFNRMHVVDAVAQSKMAHNVAQMIQDTMAMMHTQMMVFKFQSMMLQSKTMDQAFESLVYFEKIENHVYAAQAANIIGYAFETTHNLDKALGYYQKALRHNIAADNAKEAMQTRMNIADAYKAGQQFNLAKPILYEGFQYYSKSHSLKGIVATTIRLAKIYSDTEQFDSAIIFFKLTDTINKQLNLPIARIGSLGWQVQMQAKLKNFALSDSLANLVITEMLQEHHQDISKAGLIRVKEAGTITKKDMLQGNRFLSGEKISAIQLPPTQQMKVLDYERVENLNWQTGASADKDSTYLEMNSRQQLEAESKYRMPVLKDSLQTAQKNRETIQRSLNLNRLIAVGTITLLLVAATSLLLYYRKRHRIERERIQVRGRQSQLEVYHRVGNQLSTVNRMIDIAGKNEAAKLPVAILRNRVHSIVLVHQLLCNNETGTGKINLQTYFSELCGRIASIFQREQSIHIDVCAHAEVKDTIAEKLGLIVNELVTNSFKYAFTDRTQGAIQVYAKESQRQLYLTVSDDGCGLPAGNRKKGYGTKFIIGTANELKGKSSYRNEGGTFFELTIPVNV